MTKVEAVNTNRLHAVNEFDFFISFFFSEMKERQKCIDLSCSRHSFVIWCDHLIPSSNTQEAHFPFLIFNGNDQPNHKIKSTRNKAWLEAFSTEQSIFQQFFLFRYLDFALLARCLTSAMPWKQKFKRQKTKCIFERVVQLSFVHVAMRAVIVFQIHLLNAAHMRYTRFVSSYSLLIILNSFAKRRNRIFSSMWNEESRSKKKKIAIEPNKCSSNMSWM